MIIALCDLREARAEIVGGAGGDRAELDLLGRAATEQGIVIVIEQLLSGLQIAVLVGEVERVAERPAARHDRDAMDAVDPRQHLGAEGVAGLVVGDDALLVVVEHAAGLGAGDHALERVVEVGGVDPVAVAARGEDRRLVADVGQVGAGQAGGLAGDEVEVDIADGLVAAVDAQDLDASA